MQVIVKTNYNNKEEKEVIENVRCISECGFKVLLCIVDNEGCKTVRSVVLNGYTELIIR